MQHSITDKAADMEDGFASTDSVDEDASWHIAKLRFSELRDLIEMMRCETIKQAIAHQLKLFREEKAYPPDNHWQIIPYIDAIDKRKLVKNIREAKTIIPFLKWHFDHQTASAKFVRMWGLFCSKMGILEFMYWSTSDTGLRGKSAIGGEVRKPRQQLRWVSHYFKKLDLGYGKRQAANESIERLVKSIISNPNAVPAGFMSGPET